MDTDAAVSWVMGHCAVTCSLPRAALFAQGSDASEGGVKASDLGGGSQDTPVGGGFGPEDIVGEGGAKGQLEAWPPGNW